LHTCCHAERAAPARSAGVHATVSGAIPRSPCDVALVDLRGYVA